MDSNIKSISTTEIDPKKIDLLGPIVNDYPPLKDKEFITKESCEELAKVFRLTTFENISKDWKLK